MANFIGVRHQGLAAKDPAKLAAFYSWVMGMTVRRQTPADAPIGATVFLTCHPEGDEDHDLVFFANPALAHTAFEVGSLSELQTAYREIKQRGVTITHALNHGVSLSFYFDDSEGNNIEVYWSTSPDPRVRERLAAARRYAVPIDLDLPEEELLREVKRTQE
ncbi:MAG: VOC family protein [Ktedonobacterales bacterium]